jgi:hypothetical protein
MKLNAGEEWSAGFILSSAISLVFLLSFVGLADLLPQYATAASIILSSTGKNSRSS